MNAGGILVRKVRKFIVNSVLRVFCLTINLKNKNNSVIEVSV